MGDDCAYAGDYYGDGYGGDYYGDDYDGYYGGDMYGYGGDIYGGDIYGYGYYPQYTPPPAPVDRYQPDTVRNGGMIEGVVTWKSAPRVPASLPAISTSHCDASMINPTLTRSPSGGVANTIVYLADITYGKQYASIGGTLEQRGCTLAPHMQLAAPIGSNLQLANHDAIARRLNVKRYGEEGNREGVDLQLGALTVREIPLMAAGVYEIGSDDDRGIASAWVVVPRHPYYAITDSDGRFRLDDVPPGEYTLIAWHEPVILSTDEKTGAITRGSVVEAKARVKVIAGQVTRHDVDLK